MYSYLGSGSNQKSLINLQLLSKPFSTYSPIHKNTKNYSITNNNNNKNNKKPKQLKTPWKLSKIINFERFRVKLFINHLVENLSLNTTYSLLIKVGYSDNSFYMAGKQIGIVVKHFHNIRYYEDIYGIIANKIEELETSDPKQGKPDTVYMLLKEVIPLPGLELTNIKPKELNKKIIKPVDTNKLFNYKYLPLTPNISYFGNLLVGSLKNMYLDKLIKNMKFLGKEVPEYLNTLGLDMTSKVLLNKKKTSKSKNTKSYLTVSRSYDSKFNENRCFIRTVFDMSTGIKLLEVFDYIVDDFTFTRKFKDTKLTIKNGAITRITKDINFNPIFNIFGKLSSKQSFMSNPNFGVLDIETYKDLDGLSKTYAIGYRTLLENISHTFYLTDISSTLDSNYLIIHCIDLMLIPKYHNYFFYAQNLGKFDVVFIYKVLKEFNLHNNKEYYIMKTIFRDDVMLKLTVSIKLSNKKYIKITFVDSLNYFTKKEGSLDILSKDFEVGIEKGFFPYKFVNKNNLNYIGETPSMFFYTFTDISEYYDKVYVQDGWDMKKEAIKYLEKDLEILLTVLEKFSTSLFVEFNLQMTEGLTVSRLALNLYLKRYLRNHEIPIINKLQHFNFINFGYYGGITEVYIPYGENLKSYDVNSLYPYVALNPMPGTSCNYIESFEDSGLELDNLFGFFQAQVKTNDNLYIGLLPIKTDKGLIFPTGEFEGVWSSEELKLARDNGYKIKISKGYNFNKVEGVFSEYVTELFKLKAKATGSLRAVIKSLLNNLLGRFGMNIIKPVTKSVNKEKFNYITSTRKVTSYHEITENDFLITYLPTVDEQICTEHGLDFIKVLEKDNNSNLDKNIDVFKDVSIAISAMVTSYARIFMSKIRLEILNKGGKIYYIDTDGIVTDIDLSLIDPNLVGAGLGKFKLVHLIKEAYFISNKTYCLVLEDGTVTVKSKGVVSDEMDLEDFKTLYYQAESIRTIKRQTVRDYTKGSVSIDTVDVYVSSESFTKREKIYNSEGLWIDTKPLIYNNTTKDIVLINKNDNK
jgi:DNA polymerase type B, organellar and viral